MKYPKMIIFDYGHTLIYESGFDGIRGDEAVLQYAIKNKNKLSAKEVNSFSQELFEKLSEVRRSGFEIHEWQFQKLLYEYLEIKISLSKLEMETVFWDAAAPGEIMPNADKMIDYINKKGIRSAVISNIAFSDKALTNKINRLLPNNKFEFVLASSEYGIRKPDSLLFELALKKAEIKADEVWFCGDNSKADAEGAAHVGMFPVWYTNSLECAYRNKAEEATPKCEHLHISRWTELIDALDKLEV